MIKVILSIIRKNIQAIGHDKISTVFTVLGPLLLILLLGVSISSSELFGVTIGHFGNADYSEFIGELESGSYTLVAYEESCVEDVRTQDIALCLEINDADERLEVLFHADPARVDVVYLLITVIERRVSALSDELAIDLTTTFLEQLQETSKNITSSINRSVELSSTFSADARALLPTVVQLNELVGSSDSLEQTAKKIGEFPLPKRGDLLITERFISSEYASTCDSTQSTRCEKLNEARILLNEFGDDYDDIQAFRDLMREWANESPINTSSIPDAESMRSSLDELDLVLASFENISSQSLDNISAEQLASPLFSAIKPISPYKPNPLQRIFPALLLVVISMSGLIIGGSVMSREQKSGAFFRNLIAPVHNSVLFLGHLLSTILIIIVQVIIIVLIGLFAFDISLSGWWWVTAIALVAPIIIFSAVGFIVSLLFADDQVSTLLNMLIAIVILFFSGIIIPIEQIIPAIQSVSQYSPMFLGESLLREGLFYQTYESLLPAGLLVFQSIVCVLLAGVLFHIRSEGRSIRDILRGHRKRPHAYTTK